MKKRIIILGLGMGVSQFTMAQTTYSDIAPALIENCGACHRPGGGAPFSVLNYTETYNHRFAIEHEVDEGFMPPWGADTAYMHFVNERPISQADKNAILQWISDGGLEGDPNALPTPPNYPSTLLNGTPDLVLTMPTIQSNASGADAYNTIVIPTGIVQDRYIRAVEVIPAEPELAHHVVIAADSAGKVQNELTGTSFNPEGDIAIGGYQPGANPIVFPNAPQLKMGIKLPTNADLVLQIHTPDIASYGPTLGDDINLEIQIFLYPVGVQGIREVKTFVPLIYWGNDFWFNPEEIKTMSVDVSPFILAGGDKSIYSALPHSHQICTEILNYAHYNGDTIPLIKIDRWDFEHQEYYYYKNLVKVPSNYRYHADHTYDNTSNNHHNPFDPPQFIEVGTNSTDEMLFDSFQYLLYQPGDENINVDSILSNDPLLNYPEVVSGLEQEHIRIKPSYVSPNPVADVANLYFVHPHQNWEVYQLLVYDIQGKQVEINYTIKIGFFSLSKGNLPAGLYTYQINDQQTKVGEGKIVIQ